MSLYIFDTNSLSAILNHYYRDRFPTFWEKFENSIKSSSVLSVREVKKELENRFNKSKLELFSRQNKDFFAQPTNEELNFITKIYSHSHFIQNLERTKLLNGGSFADPFIIAKAKVLEATLVTEEMFKPNGVKIPNICNHFKIDFTNLEGFLKRENWTF